MAGDDPGFIRESEKAGVDGVDDLLVVAAGQVGAANASREEGVAGEDHSEWGEVKTNRALGVSGGMDYVGGVVLEADAETVGESLIGRCGLGRLDAEPCRLSGHHLEQWQICFVEVDGGAGERLEFECAADVVDVGVGDEDLLQCEAELSKPAVNAGDFVTGIDDDCFARLFVGEDCAVALEWTDGEGLENHELTLGRESIAAQSEKDRL